MKEFYSMDDYYDALEHHGIKGQKWGVRRYRNEDGSLTSEGKRRYNSDGDSGSERRKLSDEQKRTLRNVAIGVGVGAGLATAAYVYARNKPAIDRAVASSMSKAKSSGRDAKAWVELYSEAGRNKAKSAFKNMGSSAKAAGKNFKAGVHEGIVNAPKEAGKKAVTAVITGTTLLAAKAVLDEAVGKEESAKIFQAANPKKVSSFWKVNDERDKDDD